MFKYIFMLLPALLMLKNSLAQPNFIKTNVIGYLNSQFINPTFKDEFGPYYSLGYERGIDSLRFSLGAQFNYGYTSVYGSSGGTNIENTDVTSWKGSALFFDARYYPALLKRSKNKGVKNLFHRGFFIGTYLGMMQLYETYYANYSLFDGSRYDKFRTIDVQKIWIYGMGLEGGYKF
ncbi:MAG: hypothetical protein H7296_06955, partial [Bacteroidia bacterium]|nr:hypothetical protein [Bacteroidia bacterium]